MKLLKPKHIHKWIYLMNWTVNNYDKTRVVIIFYCLKCVKAKRVTV